MDINLLLQELEKSGLSNDSKATSRNEKYLNITKGAKK